MMFTPDLLLKTPWLSSMAVHHAVAAHEISAFLLLVPGYFIELGFFGIVLLMAWGQRKERSEGESALLFWTVATLVCATFLRSKVIETNDFGSRSMLLAQFCLLLLGVQVLERCSRNAKRWLLGFALLGAIGTVYQITMLRISLPRQEAAHDPDVGDDLQRQEYVFRDVWSALDTQVPMGARVQYNIVDNDYWQRALMLQATRQIVSGDGGCDVAFGGEATACPGIQQGIQHLFQGKELDAVEARTTCAAIGAEYLVVTRWDPAWRDPKGWVWTLPAVVERPEAHVVACAPRAR
jgi:hypothetical protein